MHSAKYKIVVEQHKDGFVAYPLGSAGSITGQGDTADEALADVQSAIRFHTETFGKDVFADSSSLVNAYVTDIHLMNDG
jgi:predicted RNase H-like HicB family nuclease